MLPVTRNLSLGNLLIAAFALVLVATVAITATLVNRAAGHGVDTAVTAMRIELGTRIDHELRNHVAGPWSVVQFNAADLRDFRDMRALQSRFWNQLRASPGISAIFAATAEKNFAGVEHLPDGRWTKTFSGAGTGHAFTTHLVDDGGNELERLGVLPDYDPRTRPHYRSAMAASGQVWTEIYPFPLHSALYIASVARAASAQGTPAVVAAALSLGRIGAFLKSLRIGNSGRAFIVERSGLMVASGADEPLFREQEGRIVRVRVEESADPMIRRSASAMRERLPELGSLKTAQHWRLDDDRQPLLLQLQPFSDGHGIDWVVGIVVPEQDFFGEIDATRRKALMLAVAGLVVAMLLSAALANWLVKPIRRLAAVAQRVSEGELDERARITGTGEVQRLATAFNVMADRIVGVMRGLEERVAERTQELETVNARLAEQSTTDGLTGIPNRRRFDEVAAVEWQRAQRQKTMLAVGLVDVDFFKAYNDHHGHIAGDECLRALARALAGAVRVGGDFVARFGGEEFVVLIPGRDESEAIGALQRLRTIVQSLALPHGHSAVADVVTVSIGMAAAVPGPGDRFAELLGRADARLYRAKESGRNRVCFGDDEPGAAPQDGAP